MSRALPVEIGDDEPVTLAEACNLFFGGRLTPSALRTEAAKGNLDIIQIARKDFVTRPPIERRVTPWVNVESRPEWAGSTIAAYRIWIEFDGRHWYQLHEWETRHGNRERWSDGWINGLRGWPANALPTDEEPPVP